MDDLRQSTKLVLLNYVHISKPLELLETAYLRQKYIITIMYER